MWQGQILGGVLHRKGVCSALLFSPFPTDRNDRKSRELEHHPRPLNRTTYWKRKSDKIKKPRVLNVVGPPYCPRLTSAHVLVWWPCCRTWICILIYVSISSSHLIKYNFRTLDYSSQSPMSASWFPQPPHQHVLDSVSELHLDFIPPHLHCHQPSSTTRTYPSDSARAFWLTALPPLWPLPTDPPFSIWTKRSFESI